MNRREFLTTGIVAGVAASAGCASSTEPAPVRTGDAVPGWRMYGRDPARTYTAPVKGNRPESTPLWSKYGDRESTLEDPVMTTDTAYVAYGPDSEYRETSYIEALDLETGRRNWRTPLDANRIGTPLVAPDANRVFVNAAPRTGDTGVLYALDAQSGAIVATRTVDDAGVGPILRTQNGILSCRDRGTVAVRRYDSATLRKSWSRSEISRIPTASTDTVYLATTDRTLDALNAATGEREWTVDMGPTRIPPVLTEYGIHVLVNKSVQTYAADGTLRRTIGLDPKITEWRVWHPIVTASSLVLNVYSLSESADSIISIPHHGEDIRWSTVYDGGAITRIGLGGDFVADLRKGGTYAHQLVNAESGVEKRFGEIQSPVAATGDHLLAGDQTELIAYRWGTPSN
ncbi:outer membrane protein assembly factor BamB family protein [Salarchaeum japonicum]|uniref:Pyrrolo-quinoline quinone repeat domain-containing protein n=1 Tax=Salarchaeum japonicum TaxID=555573 RepID=A0AAV3SXJ5_9EURY|nr:PQQ-binding-like beta-propeller repeat protein [Salarchaeum japonicum]